MDICRYGSLQKDIRLILNNLKKRKLKLKKIIFLGDVRHFFSYTKIEKNLFLELLNLLDKYIKRENIIIIRGNHETTDKIADKRLIDYYIKKNIAFIHGDKIYPKIFDKKIKIIVMGHLHPAVSLKDPQKIKNEKYKCFLKGEYKRKDIIILPSFLPNTEGFPVNEYMSNSHCIIPAKNLMNFKVYAIGKSKIYDFGILKKLHWHSW